MNAYDAIMKAADSIESFPDLFDYKSIDLPNRSCNTPGCAIGWIAFHRGVNCTFKNPSTGAPTWASKLKKVIEISDGEFYSRMNELRGDEKWKEHADICAKTLRAYARKYHALEKPKGIPAAVLEIFEAELA